MTDVSFKRINSSRFLIYAPLNLDTPTHNHPIPAVISAPPPPAALSSTARRIIRKKSAYIRVIDQSLVSLGTVDIRPSTLLPYIPSSTNKRRRSPTGTNSPTHPLSPQPCKKPSPVPSSSSVTHTPEPFKVVIASRPAPRLPLFHPGNTDPLPEIEVPQVLAPAPVNNAPRRSSARARKPAAKALALSLGQGSDGSGLLDPLDTSRDTHANDKSSNDGAAEDRNNRSASATTKPVKEEIINNNTAADASSSSSQSAAPKTRRSAVKRKAAQVDPIIEDDSGVSAPPANKRPRRGGLNSDVAPVHAPSPLANEVARGPSQSPVETAKKRPSVSPISISKDKDKASPGLVSPAQSTSAKATAPPKPKPATSSKPKPAAPAKATSTKVKEPEPTKTRMRSNSSTLSPVSEQLDIESEDNKSADKKTAKTLEEDDEEGEDDEDEDDKRKFVKVNIFEEPIELKPRPRPTYKMHLKRISTSSLGDESGAARKRRNSKTHSRKNSEAVNAIASPLSPIKDKDSFKHSPVERAKVTQDDGMDVDPVVPSPDVPTGSVEAADSVSTALPVVA
ncbi:hypothetical protein FRC02_002538 [Tulasnella sp. 418]|nr:hypothetical protein FRC02_002538 [Tulasnella sp. 418]